METECIVERINASNKYRIVGETEECIVIEDRVNGTTDFIRKLENVNFEKMIDRGSLDINVDAITRVLRRLNKLLFLQVSSIRFLTDSEWGDKAESIESGIFASFDGVMSSFYYHGDVFINVSSISRMVVNNGLPPTPRMVSGFVFDELIKLLIRNLHYCPFLNHEDMTLGYDMSLYDDFPYTISIESRVKQSLINDIIACGDHNVFVQLAV